MKKLFLILFVFVLNCPVFSQDPVFTLVKVGFDNFNFFYDIKASPEGTLWVCSNEGNVFRKLSSSTTWEHISDYPGTGAEANALFVAEDDDVWIISYGNGIFHFNGTKWEEVSLTNVPETNKWNCVSGDLNGNVWFGSNDKGLYKYSAGQWTNYSMSNSGILSDQINDLLATPSGKLFVGGYRTLQTFESNNWVDLGFTSNIGFSERTYSFAIDNDGLVYIATTKGLFKFKDDKLEIYGDTKNRDVYYAVFDRNNVLWFFGEEQAFDNYLYRCDNGTCKKLDDKNLPHQCSGLAVGSDNLLYLIGSLGPNILVIEDKTTNSDKELLRQPMVEISPNPASDFLSIKSPQTLKEISLFNSAGQSLFAAKNINQTHFMLNLQGRGKINPGVYVLLIKTEIGTCRKKIMIQ